MRAIAINVGANTSLPGFRGPIYPDGRFVYVPIPEREPTRVPVPTYDDLDLPIEIPDAHLDTQIHLDPSFAEYPLCRGYTYGDEHGVKAGPLASLSAGDYVFFYATLTTVAAGSATAGERSTAAPVDAVDWIAPEWGAYLIGHFELATDPVTGEEYAALSPTDRERFADNAHVKRETVDARVLLDGDPAGSRLYDVAVPLSSPEAGSEPNWVVTELSEDSGKGPWWRRPLRFDDAATLLELATEGVQRG